jgi:ferredoxin
VKHMAPKHHIPPFLDESDQESAVADSYNIAAGIALPIYEEIKLSNTVLNLNSVKNYIDKATRLSVKDCVCRTKRKNCDHPLETCLQLNDAADANIAKEKAREITKEEAVKIVKMAHEAGLVPMAYTRTDTPKPEGVNYICNCCSCSCSVWGATLKLGKNAHLVKSIATTLTDAVTCTSCGACVERCHFNARKIVDGKLEFNKDLCFGCGLCVDTCLIKAIRLIPLQ